MEIDIKKDENEIEINEPINNQLVIENENEKNINVKEIINETNIQMEKNFSTTLNPQNFDQIGDDQVNNILSKLKFLSKIKIGEKINSKYYFVRDNNSILQRFLRSMRNLTAENSENKNSTLEFISDTVNRTIHLICIYKKSNNIYSKQISDLLIENLNDTKTGIKNLTKTYEDDRIFVSKLESFIESFDLKLQNIK